MDQQHRAAVHGASILVAAARRTLEAVAFGETPVAAVRLLSRAVPADAILLRSDLLPWRYRTIQKVGVSGRRDGDVAAGYLLCGKGDAPQRMKRLLVALAGNCRARPDVEAADDDGRDPHLSCLWARWVERLCDSPSHAHCLLTLEDDKHGPTDFQQTLDDQEALRRRAESGVSAAAAELAMWGDPARCTVVEDVARAVMELLADDDAATGDNRPPVASQSGRASPVGSGMSAEDARAEAERLVKADGGEWPGVNKLMERVGCAKGTIRKAVADSTYLKARKAEHDRAKRPKGRTVPLSHPAADPDAADPLDAAAEAERLRLIAEMSAESAAEERREARQHRAAAKGLREPVA